MNVRPSVIVITLVLVGLFAWCNQPKPKAVVEVLKVPTEVAVPMPLPIFVAVETCSAYSVCVEMLDCLRCPNCDSELKLEQNKRAQKRLDRALDDYVQRLDDATVDTMQCETALAGWNLATEKWNDACRGDERACL